MTVFSGISLFYQNLLQLLLFVMLLAELYLLIEKISHRAPGQLCLVSSIMLTLNFLLLLFLLLVLSVKSVQQQTNRTSQAIE